MITGYRAEVDPRRARLRLRRRHPHPAGARASWPIVADLAPRDARGGGVPPRDRRRLLLVIAYVRDVEHLEQVIDRFAAYGQTTSSIMQSSPVPRRPIVSPAPS